MKRQWIVEKMSASLHSVALTSIADNWPSVE